MRYSILGAFFLTLSVSLPLQAQETFNITTVYPSPAGYYENLTVHQNFTLVDPSDSAEVLLSVDAGGNLTANSTEDFSQVYFDDYNRAYCYLQAYSGLPPTDCPTGYVRIGILKSDKSPVNPSASLPSSGFIVCLRGE